MVSYSYLQMFVGEVDIKTRGVAEDISWTDDLEVLSETDSSWAWLDSTAAEAATQAATELMTTLVAGRDQTDDKESYGEPESVGSECVDG